VASGTPPPLLSADLAAPSARRTPLPPRGPAMGARGCSRSWVALLATALRFAPLDAAAGAPRPHTAHAGTARVAAGEWRPRCVGAAIELSDTAHGLVEGKDGVSEPHLDGLVTRIPDPPCGRHPVLTRVRPVAEQGRCRGAVGTLHGNSVAHCGSSHACRQPSGRRTTVSQSGVVNRSPHARSAATIAENRTRQLPPKAHDVSRGGLLVHEAARVAGDDRKGGTPDTPDGCTRAPRGRSASSACRSPSAPRWRGPRPCRRTRCPRARRWCASICGG
jgi:hypothetical protein